MQSAKYNFQVNYATGSVVGQVAYDTVSLGNPTVTISNQGFGLATDSTSDFLSTSCDGLWVSQVCCCLLQLPLLQFIAPASLQHLTGHKVCMACRQRLGSSA